VLISGHDGSNLRLALAGPKNNASNPCRVFLKVLIENTLMFLLMCVDLCRVQLWNNLCQVVQNLDTGRPSFCGCLCLPLPGGQFSKTVLTFARSGTFVDVTLAG